MIENTQKITKSIILNQLALNANVDIKNTPLYKHNIKRLLNPLINELIKLEKKEYDLIDSEDITENVSSNILSFVDIIMKNDLCDSVILMNIISAYYKNPKAITGIVNKILN